MNKKILLVGGGGHCKSVLDSILLINDYSEIGIVDKAENIGTKVCNIPIIGCDNDLPRLYEDGYKHAFLTLGSIGNPIRRIELFTMLEKIGFIIPNILDPSAVISKFVSMEKGIYVGKNAVINNGASLERCTIINTSVTIEHDCIIKGFAHIASSAVLCGGVKIGANTHIGAKSAVKQYVKIGDNSIIGMGSNVLQNIGDFMLAYGNPCKGVRKL
ncbi:MAG: acetyltransferase [Clostridia bacterium]|nr:acetyltransferase [Clostridia bacterium]